MNCIPWRQRVEHNHAVCATSDFADKMDRSDQAMLTAIQVFGNYEDACLWLLRPSYEFGVWETPLRVAEAAPGDLERVLMRLRELTAVIRPKPPKPVPTKVRLRDARRRR